MRNPLITDAMLCPSRRTFLAGAGAFTAWSVMPKFAFAGQTRDPRFLTVILRGAMDGLAVVPPVGDPDYPALRGDLAIGTANYGQTFALNDFFGLNEALPSLWGLYQKGEALIVHAAATAYRDRSHFDGQDVLESGMIGPRLSENGLDEPARRGDAQGRWRAADQRARGDANRAADPPRRGADAHLDAARLQAGAERYGGAAASISTRIAIPAMAQVLQAGVSADTMAGDGADAHEARGRARRPVQAAGGRFGQAAAAGGRTADRGALL